MTALPNNSIPRRHFLTGAAAAGLLALPGCASMGGYSFTEAIRRLLLLSSENAFARLTAPGGFWDSQVARIALPEIYGKRGGVMQGILTSDAFRSQLQRRLNFFAEEGAYRAAPVVAETVRTIGIANAVALIRGGPTAATSYLRENMAGSLINTMVPALGDAMRLARDPLLGQALVALTGVDIGAAAQSLAIGADNAIWSQIGAEEAEIRLHPDKTNDPVLIGVLKVL
jgi:hypothetical protein